MDIYGNLTCKPPKIKKASEGTLPKMSELGKDGCEKCETNKSCNNTLLLRVGKKIQNDQFSTGNKSVEAPLFV
jgi:hypothetical protein